LECKSGIKKAGSGSNHEKTGRDCRPEIKAQSKNHDSVVKDQILSSAGKIFCRQAPSVILTFESQHFLPQS
jgi:hypothetical protein